MPDDRLTAKHEPRLVVGRNGTDEPRDHTTSFGDRDDVAPGMNAIDQ